MKESSSDWRTWSPEARAILQATAALYFDGDVDEACRRANEEWAKVRVLPRPINPPAYVHLQAVKHSLHPQ
jgi:hypothetical protein